MTNLLARWLLSALALFLVAKVVPGIRIAGFGTALVTAFVFGFVNATLGFVLKIVTFPFTIITFGIFLVVINALMLKLAAALVPGFEVRGFFPAFVGAILLSLVNLLLRHLLLS